MQRTGMDVAAGVGDRAVGAVTASAGHALVQLCGEVLLQAPPTRQPGIVRPGAAVGLELLDLLLNPDHVVRVTENLTLRNTLTLGRRVHLDVSLDRLSLRNEKNATLLSALMSGRVGSYETRTPDDDQRLWLPLCAVPRPLSVPVTVSDSAGRPLPRPPQRELRLALQAALYHALRESLLAHAELAPREAAVSVITRGGDRARWLLQSAVVAVCDAGPDTPSCAERRDAVEARLGGLDLARLSPAEQRLRLDQLVHEEADSHRRVALAAVGEALVDDTSLLRLLDLVHRHDFVVACLDRKVRDQTVLYDLPDSEALPSSLVERPLGRSLRMIDPREHNFTVHMLVPLPENLSQYNLCLRAPARGGPEVQTDYEVSLIAAIHYEGHPAQGAIDALSACADELARTFESAGSDWPPTDGPLPDPDPQVRKVRFIASRANAALDRIERIVDLQDRASDELAERWSRASTWTVRQSTSQLHAVTGNARRSLQAARRRLVSGPPRQVRPQAAHAARALWDVVDAVQHRLLALQLVSSEVPGQEVARLRIDQADLACRIAPHPRAIEVWATVSDEAQPPVYTAAVQPLALTALLYLVGSLLLDTGRWPVHLSDPLTTSILAGGPDAIVAVLLLIPAFALTRTGLPERWSVAGFLRRPARVFVIGSVVMLCLTAIMVATQVGTETDDPHDQALHPHLMLWAFRASLIFFIGWTAWATVALGLRRRYVWRPKGLNTLFGPEADRSRDRVWNRGRGSDRGRGHGTDRDRDPDGCRGIAGRTSLRGRLHDLVRYAGKVPDARFDLSRPSRSFPSHGREP